MHVPACVTVPVAPGTRMLVAGGLRLAWRPTETSLSVSAELAQALDGWIGPGVLVLDGDVFDFTDDSQEDPGRVVDAHPRLAASLARFTGCEGRRILLVPGTLDRALTERPKSIKVLADRFGTEVADRVRLEIETGAGTRVVEIEHGGRFADEDSARPDEGSVESSRLAYRRLSRQLLGLVAPFVIALVLLVAFVVIDAVGPLSAHRLLDWSGRLALLGTIAAVGALVLLVVLHTYRSFAGLRDLPEEVSTERARARADELIAAGATGLVTSCVDQPELAHLGRGFYANVGANGLVVRRHATRLGLPPVFTPERQLCWLELEAGADVHARLLYGRLDVPGTSLLERLAIRSLPEHVARPTVVAGFPSGDDWPKLRFDEEIVRRRVRRRAGVILALFGLVNLLSGLTPPVRGRLELIRDLVPVTVPQTASALTAATGIGLLLVSRGVRRGQHLAWLVAIGITSLSAALHLVKGLDVEESIVAFAVLAYLLAHRADFAARPDRSSLGRALGTLGLGAAVAVAVGMATALWIPDRSGMPVGRAFLAVTERLVGIDSITIPGRREHFLTAALAGVGLALAATAGWLLFRPVVLRRAETRDWSRARELVARYGGDTLSYFALRDDKDHWFWHDTLVAYAVHNGVCLVSPDPIGPRHQRVAAWRAFREFADNRGWMVAVMGAGEEWLPTYRATGMRDLYVGDEAVVDCSRFSLDGGRMKSLRQAVNRIEKYGYRIEFHDPAHLDPALEQRLRALMTESRRGEVERGFSMTLGRVFSPHDTGLLLAVCFGPSGDPAAFCQYVPATDIDGFSLDLMRRSESDEHWNGLTDYVVVRTIEHLRDRGMTGLGLNFAVMRSVLAHETGDRLGQRIERWMLGWLSDSMQIESLWKYNAKFDPDWRPRYAVYEAAENFLSSAIAVAKAESFWELPVIGRFFEPDEQPS